MQLAASPAFYEPPLAAMPQLAENSRQGFSTKYPAWKPGPNVCNSTVVIGMRAGLVLECVRKTYRARYYNPATGRFLSEDPIGFAGSGTNFYAYAADNPISYRDPTGLANQNLFDPSTDPDLHSAANDWNPSGYYSVAGHGDVYENGISAGTLAGLTPQQLAQLIQKDPNWKKQPIILRSCRTGQGGAKSFAQQLANLLGVQVTAPINDATWWMFPNFFTGNEISLGTTGGNFIPFYPVVGNPNLMWVR
jgi:hypothetical protein